MAGQGVQQARHPGDLLVVHGQSPGQDSWVAAALPDPLLGAVPGRGGRGGAGGVRGVQDAGKRVGDAAHPGGGLCRVSWCSSMAVAWMMPPALTTTSGAQRMPRSCSRSAVAGASSWLLAGPAITAQRSAGTDCAVSRPPRAAGTRTSTSAVRQFCGLVQVAPYRSALPPAGTGRQNAYGVRSAIVTMSSGPVPTSGPVA